MKKVQLLLVVLMLTSAVAAMVGCDKRSDLQKSIDSAASDAKSATKDAEKKLGL